MARSRLAILCVVVSWALSVPVFFARADDAMPKILAEATSGDDDCVVSIKGIMTSVDHARSIGLQTEFLHRTGLDHDPRMLRMTPEILHRARDRLDRKPWSGNCPTTPSGASKS